MSPLLEVVVAVGVIAYVIARQVRGEPMRIKRVVLLPAILTVAGLVELGRGQHPVRPVELLVPVPGAVIAVGIGLGQGWMMRLESRNGTLWGQMPIRGLALWLALIGSRLLLAWLAHGLDATAATGSSAILLMLGLSRLGQAAIVVLRAHWARMPFAPEQDSRRVLRSQPGGRF